MPQLKLLYFNGPGRMEPLRWIMEAGGVSYSTEFISFEQWPDKKTTTPYGSMPILEVDGKPICETLAIARFLGNLTGLVHSDPNKNAIGDEVVDITASLVSGFLDIILHCKDESLKASKMEDLVNNTMKKKFNIWEARIQGAYLEGDKPMWQDIFMAHWLNRFREYNKTLLNDYPKLEKVVGNVLAMEKIKAYLASPPTYNLPL